MGKHMLEGSIELAGRLLRIFPRLGCEPKNRRIHKTTMNKIVHRHYMIDTYLFLNIASKQLNKSRRLYKSCDMVEEGRSGCVVLQSLDPCRRWLGIR